MTRLKRPALFMLVVMGLCLAGIAADKAKDLYEKGADAQARQDYEKAFEYFKQAYDLKPKDLRYRTAYERNKFLAASSHVHRGQILRDAGKLGDAKLEFEKALLIDPSSFIAQQELKRTLQMIQEAEHPQPQASSRGGSGELRKLLSEARGPVDLAPISNAPITLKLTEKSNVIYETVGQAGRRQRAVRSRLYAQAGAHRTERRHAGRGAVDHLLRNQDVLASDYAEYDFCRTRQSRKAERAGSKTFSKLFIFPIFRSRPNCRM